MQYNYKATRSLGGAKGLGTGAKSYNRGAGKINKYVNKQNTQKKKFQQILQTIPNDGRRMKPEVKVVDTLIVNSAISQTYNLTYVNLVQEGTGFWNRIGRKICMKSLYFTGFISRTMENDAALLEDYIRIIVVYDRQANGAIFNFNDLIQSVDQLGTGVSSTAIDHINMNNRERFIVLMDKRIQTPPVGVAGVTATNTNLTTDMNFDGNDSGFRITRFIKLHDLETHYLSTHNPCTIADITTGALGVVFISERGIADDEAWHCQWTSRLKFYDV